MDRVREVEFLRRESGDQPFSFSSHYRLPAPHSRDVYKWRGAFFSPNSVEMPKALDRGRLIRTPSRKNAMPWLARVSGALGGVKVAVAESAAADIHRRAVHPSSNG